MLDTIQLTDEQLEQYRDQGYCLVKDLIPRDLVAQVWERTRQVARGEHEWSANHFQVVDPKRHARPDGSSIPWGIQRPALAEPLFREMAEHPNLAGAMAQLLGGEVELFTDQIGFKHGWLNNEQGGRSYFHQDSYYWKIDPELGCNCWIPMCDVDRDAIALAVMPGSQRGWDLLPHESYYDDPPLCSATSGQAFMRHRIPQDQIDFSKEALIPMAPGDGLFFTNYTWHRSEPNRTGQDKAFYAIAYQIRDAGTRPRQG